MGKMTKRDLRKALGERKVNMHSADGVNNRYIGWVSGDGWTDSRRPKKIMQDVFDISEPLGKNEFFDIKGNVKHRKLKFFKGV